MMRITPYAAPSRANNVTLHSIRCSSVWLQSLPDKGVFAALAIKNRPELGRLADGKISPAAITRRLCRPCEHFADAIIRVSRAAVRAGYLHWKRSLNRGSHGRERPSGVSG